MKKNKAYTLNELEEMNKAFEQRIADARAEIEQNKLDISAIEKKMDAATEKGDIVAYKALYTQRADLDLNIAAVSAILEKAIENHTAGFSDEDVCAAWAVWADEHNAKAAANAERFNAMIDECRKLYEDMRKEMWSAEGMRDKYASFASLESRPDRSRQRLPYDFKDLAGLPDSRFYFND